MQKFQPEQHQSEYIDLENRNLRVPNQQLREERKHQTTMLQPQDSTKRPLPAFLAQNERKVAPSGDRNSQQIQQEIRQQPLYPNSTNENHQVSLDYNHLSVTQDQSMQQAEVEPLTQEQRDRIESSVSGMAALTMKAQEMGDQSDQSVISLQADQKAKVDSMVSQMAALTLQAQQQSNLQNPLPPQQNSSNHRHQYFSRQMKDIPRIHQTSKHIMSDRSLGKIVARRAKKELPSFMVDNPEQRDLPPLLNDSTILEVKESFNEQSFINDVNEIIKIGQSRRQADVTVPDDPDRIDLTALDEAMLKDSHERSMSDDTRFMSCNSTSVVIDSKFIIAKPEYPRLVFNRSKTTATNNLDNEKLQQSINGEEESKMTNILQISNEDMGDCQNNDTQADVSVWEDIEVGEDQLTPSRKYFRDDSVLIGAPTMRERRQQLDLLEKEKKIPQGQDRTQVIYVQVPAPDATDGFIMEEFEFHLDQFGKTYEYRFGHTLLKIFDWRKYQRMLRQFKQRAIQKGDIPEDDGKGRKKGATTIDTYDKPENWCTLEDFPVMQDVFDMNCFMDSQFVEKMLTLYKPRATDGPGFVYILQRQTDCDKKRDGEIDHILLHKIGMTCKTPQTRINQQSRANSEQYHVLAYFRTSFHKYFEYACHRYFQERRVVKGDSKDGGTEWFLIEPSQLLPGIQKIRKALHYMFNDKLGWKPEPVLADNN